MFGRLKGPAFSALADVAQALFRWKILVIDDRFHHKSCRMPLKNGGRSLPSADFALYSISATSDGSTQMPLCASFSA